MLTGPVAVAVAACLLALRTAPPPAEAVRPPAEIRLADGDRPACVLTVVRRPGGDRVRAVRLGRPAVEAVRLTVIAPNRAGVAGELVYEAVAEDGSVRVGRAGRGGFVGSKLVIRGGCRIELIRPAASGPSRATP